MWPCAQSKSRSHRAGTPGWAVEGKFHWIWWWYGGVPLIANGRKHPPTSQYATLFVLKCLKSQVSEVTLCVQNLKWHSLSTEDDYQGLRVGMELPAQLRNTTKWCLILFTSSEFSLCYIYRHSIPTTAFSSRIEFNISVKEKTVFSPNLHGNPGVRLLHPNHNILIPSS